jgi:hypothetical protein
MRNSLELRKMEVQLLRIHLPRTRVNRTRMGPHGVDTCGSGALGRSAGPRALRRLDPDLHSLACFLVALQEELTLTSPLTAVASTLNDVGPGLGQVGATESFEIVNPFGRVVLTVCMLLGRLEIFTVLALLSPTFWKR